MIDYWEAIGRLAYDPELADGFMRVLPPAGEFPVVTVKRPEGLCTGVVIPGKVYEDIQHYLEPVLAERTLSLMAAGELAWAFSYSDVRKFVKEMHGISREVRPTLSSPSASYFITLGMLIADHRFREKVLYYDSHALARIRRLPEAHVENLLSTIKSPKFIEYIRLYEAFWPLGCEDEYQYYRGLVHPLGIYDSNAEDAAKAKGAPGY